MRVDEIKNKISTGEIKISGASYVGKPVDYTIMFLTKKVEHLLVNLQGHKGCIVFLEEGIDLELLSKQCQEKNIFILSHNPQLEYAKLATYIDNERFKNEQAKKYSLTPEGYYLGEDVVIGSGTYIEPGCLIGHGVTIGNNCRILYGAVIKNSVIGNNVVVNEYAVVGSYGFTMSVDENGNKFRIPTLGKVIIGDNVEIGAHDNVSCGSGGNTVISDYTKIDALVHIGHDVYFADNVEVTAGGIIGGFVNAEQGAYVGINAVLRNRINIGSNALIGMGAVVTKSVDSSIIVAGNPAKPFVKGERK